MRTETYLHASRSGSFLSAHAFVGVFGWDRVFGDFVGVVIVVVVVVHRVRLIRFIEL